MFSNAKSLQRLSKFELPLIFLHQNDNEIMQRSSSSDVEAVEAFSSDDQRPVSTDQPLSPSPSSLYYSILSIIIIRNHAALLLPFTRSTAASFVQRAVHKHYWTDDKCFLFNDN
jgi:hypothetical protein